MVDRMKYIKKQKTIRCCFLLFVFQIITDTCMFY